jgi:hypothetical protein
MAFGYRRRNIVIIPSLNAGAEAFSRRHKNFIYKILCATV